MSEGTPNGQRESGDLTSLLRELEAQIDSVNAGLGKIRGTVARITFAATGTTTPAPAATWSSFAGAPANRNEWPAPAPAAIEAPLAEPPAASPSPTFFEDTAPPAAEPEPVQEAPAGFWTSVAEGASWPRAQAKDVEIQTEDPGPVEPEHDDFAWAGFHPATVDDSAAPSGAESVSTVEDQPSRTESRSEESPEPAVEEAVPEDWGAGSSETPRRPEAPAEPTPATLSAGWPDESAWSQSFEWPAMKRDREAEAPENAPDEAPRVDVSDIVAQVKAELAAAKADVQVPAFESEKTEGDSEPAAPVAGDSKRREDVSRAVAEIRRRIESGDYESVMLGHGYDAALTEQAQPEGVQAPLAAGEALSEEDMRAEVRRAVEAARDELSGVQEEPSKPEKPAFRLAAPGSIPDWSHIQMEPSGPPVVVMKDVDGRVELASVYETLNELGCGDGAALLNYTPHSVTVGLPISAQFPSKERVAEAVEKVFGLTSRVESDGVRITVSIGAEPKRRSVNAA